MMNKTPLWTRMAAAIELWGNRLPAPVILFMALWLLVVMFSALAVWLGWQSQHPVSGALIEPRSLLSESGVVWLLDSAVTNFTQFAPVGPVLVVMLGLGLAERSGLLGQWLRQAMQYLPGVGLTLGVVLLGILSSLAFDAGYVVVIPLSAVLFQLAGRSPLAGIAASFAAVSGGYSANLLVGPVDAILAGISTESARILTPDAEVSMVANYYFMVVSTLMLTLLISFVLHRWVEPLLQTQTPADEPDVTEGDSLAALLAAGLMLLLLAGLLLMAVPEQGILRGSGSFLQSPFMHNISLLVGLLFGLAGWCYGRLSGRYRNSRVMVSDMEDTFRALAPYLVLMFFAAQFVAAFGWSQMGLLVAVEGASLLQALQLPMVLTVVLLIVLTAGINLLLGSASAKWTLLAPVLVPMLMLTGIAPEVSQAAYRIGDSSTNIITPLMPYFPLVLALVQKYRSDAGVGTLMAMMMPFSLMMLAGWTLLLGTWLLLGWPLGPAA